MRRRVYNFVAAASLLLCVSIAVIWITSHRAPEYVHFTKIETIANVTHCDDYAIVWGHGNIAASIVRLSYAASSAPPPLAPGWRWEPAPWVNFDPHTNWERIGFWHLRDQGSAYGLGTTASGDGVACYVLVLLLGIVPAVWIYRFLRLCKPDGHCRKCGYNLTANTSGVCPKCGTLVAKKTGVAA